MTSRWRDTRPPLAVNTMSGRPATGSISLMDARCASTSCRLCHCLAASGLSTLPWLPSIQGLMTYSTSKYLGSHIKNVCMGRSRLGRCLETHRQVDRLHVLGERADGDAVHTGPGETAHVLQGDAARRLQLGAAVGLDDGPAHV